MIFWCKKKTGLEFGKILGHTSDKMLEQHRTTPINYEAPEVFISSNFKPRICRNHFQSCQGGDSSP